MLILSLPLFIQSLYSFSNFLNLLVHVGVILILIILLFHIINFVILLFHSYRTEEERKWVEDVPLGLGQKLTNMVLVSHVTFI